MMTVDCSKLMQKQAKCSMIVWGLAYLFLFPFLFFIFGPFWDSFSTRSSSIYKLLALLDLLPLFAIPFSLFLMWFSYSKTYYKITRLCWIIPILFFALALLMHIVLGHRSAVG